MPNRKPNILLVVIDCGRSDRWLGPGRRTVTANLDRLARQGVSLPVTIAEKSCTTPNFSSLLTGLYSPRHGVQYVFGCKLADHIPMLTHVLARHGYRTYAEVSGPLMPEMGLARGFDAYEYRSPYDYLDTKWGDMFRERLRTGHYRGPWFLMLHLWELHVNRRVLAAFDRPEAGADAYERAVSSLDAQLGRLFAAVPEDTCIVVTADHGEASATDVYRDDSPVGYTKRVLGLDGADGLPMEAVGWMAGPSTLHEFHRQFMERIQTVRLEDIQGTQRFTRWTRLADRLRLLWLLPFVWAHDLFVLHSPVKVTRMLKRRGLLDPDKAQRRLRRLNRFVGEDRVFQMQLRMWITTYKTNLHEGHTVHVYDFLTRVPLVLRWPGRLPAGPVHDRMVRQVDILPTIADLLGIPVEELGAIDGRSFRPLIEGEPWEPHPAFHSVSGLLPELEVHGVRTEEYRYTYGPFNADLPHELYDLRHDPGETANLAASCPDLCAQLRQMAAGFVPADGQTPVERISIGADEQERIERHLRELGYIE